MKWILIIAVLTGSNVWAFSFPNGHYQGKGTCRTEEGQIIPGEIDLIINDGNLVWIYDPHGNPMKHEMRTHFRSSGSFTFTSPSEGASGEGYCASSACHYEGV